MSPIKESRTVIRVSVIQSKCNVWSRCPLVSVLLKSDSVMFQQEQELLSAVTCLKSSVREFFLSRDLVKLPV